MVRLHLHKSNHIANYVQSLITGHRLETIAPHVQELGPFQLKGMNLRRACHNVFKVIERLVDNMRCDSCIKETMKELFQAKSADHNNFSPQQYQVSIYHETYYYLR